MLDSKDKQSSSSKTHTETKPQSAKNDNESSSEKPLAGKDKDVVGAEATTVVMLWIFVDRGLLLNCYRD